jgi:transcriptional regulator with XRE-family HTH domain
MIAFGDWLRGELKALGWTMERLAGKIKDDHDDIGPSVGTLYRLVEGRHEPNPLTRQAIEETIRKARKRR